MVAASRSTAPTSSAEARPHRRGRPRASSRRPSTTPASGGPTSTRDLFDFLRDLLTLQRRGAGWRPSSSMRFQQTTGPVMAKGVEDTAFYRYNRLRRAQRGRRRPGSFGVHVGGVPRRLPRRRSSAGPRRMLATSTHDTKRSEDVRARLAVLSEIPERWARGGRRAGPRATRSYKPDGCPTATPSTCSTRPWSAPGRSTWSAPTAYMEKARARPRQHTSWTEPNAPTRPRCAASCAAVLRRSRVRRSDLERVRGDDPRCRLGQRRWRRRCSS